ncbi:MAG: hypothetical protein KAR85_05860 [Methanosarcinales archaeon]|nr:hypothetical protein [Methanosarcinales archaeon]
MNRLLLMMFLISILLVQSSGETIPPNKWTFNDDYFTALGAPEMVVNIAGNPEYDRGETFTIQVQVMNQGKITGFESGDKPIGSNEIALSKIEQQQEYGITTAVGVVASLSGNDIPVDIKTPPQSAGTLESGQVSIPLTFDIKIWDSASAGKYPMKVDLTYQYQKDVQIDGNASNNQLDYNMLYQHVNETHEILIIIREQADFKVIEVSGDLLPGKPGILSVTFQNTGEEKASRATARLRLSDPLSSTDYTAYLGDMEPGNESRASFNIDVDSDATPKAYSVKAEIEYEDVEGETSISDIIYVPAQVRELEEGRGIFGNPLLLGAGLVIIAALIFIYMKQREGDSGSE